MRAATFHDMFTIHPDTRILDLGSGDGSHIASVLKGTPIIAANVYIADIDEAAVTRGAQRYGFQSIIVPEDGRLPFPDRYFDIVFSSSVIEHVTVPKNTVWTVTSGRLFRQRSLERQKRFADEVARLAVGYFVQTPNKWFLIESHTLLPLAGWLPRRFLIPLMRVSNCLWIKSTQPDWHLLTEAQLARLFPDATIVAERLFGMKKSIMAVKR